MLQEDGQIKQKETGYEEKDEHDLTHAYLLGAWIYLQNIRKFSLFASPRDYSFMSIRSLGEGICNPGKDETR